MNQDFDQIRSYTDEELPHVLKQLEQEPDFMRLIKFLYPEVPTEAFINKINNITSIRQFQLEIIYPYLNEIIDKTSDGISADGFENLSKDEAYFFISNHRDIVLDPAFLNLMMFRFDHDTTEIAIGDNLLVYPWIKHLVRLNKSFIVNRSVQPRELLLVSKRLSSYIKHKMQNEKVSVWMAQREGRSKDANDRTQQGVLKMLNMSGDGDFVENMQELNVVPVSISYEYDPCDFLKAREFLLKRDNPEYKKTQADDLESMYTGLSGYKGKIHFHICRPLNQRIHSLDSIEGRNEQVTAFGELIDTRIHLNYIIYPGNYVAHDLFKQTETFTDKYTPEQKQKFESYIEKQIAKIPEAPGNEDFLKNSILEMYANPLINHIAAQE